MSPLYDVILPHPSVIDRYRGRIREENLVNNRVPAANSKAALRRVLSQYKCLDLEPDILEAVERGDGQISENPQTSLAVPEFNGAYTKQVSHMPLNGRKPAGKQQKAPDNYVISLDVGIVPNLSGDHNTTGYSELQALAHFCYRNGMMYNYRRLSSMYESGRGVRIGKKPRKKKSEQLKMF